MVLWRISRFSAQSQKFEAIVVAKGYKTSSNHEAWGSKVIVNEVPVGYY